MRAIWIRRHGGPEVLEVRESPDPSPGAGEVRVRVRAAGLNFAELMARKGLYPDAPRPPCVVGYEGAGVIDAAGPGATPCREGERVLFLSRFGGHADVVCVPEEQVFTLPEGMSFEEGAALPVNYLTAYHLLFAVRRLRPGDHVLIHMAAGGVGTAALQLCRTVGGVITYGTASAGKHEHLRENGCDYPIDYRKEDYVERVIQLTQGRGVDAVLDARGGPDWRKGYSLLRPAGILVAFGLANANARGGRRLLHVASQVLQSPIFGPLKLMRDNRGVAGVNFGNLWDQIPMVRAEAEALSALYQQGKIRPHIGARFPFSRAAEAHEALEAGRTVGKVVLLPD